jgi:hypothetical protein
MLALPILKEATMRPSAWQTMSPGYSAVHFVSAGGAGLWFAEATLSRWRTHIMLNTVQAHRGPLPLATVRKPIQKAGTSSRGDA